MVVVPVKIDDTSLSSLRYPELVDHDETSPDDEVTASDQARDSDPVRKVAFTSLVGVRHSPSCSIMTFALSAIQAFL